MCICWGDNIVMARGPDLAHDLVRNLRGLLQLPAECVLAPARLQVDGCDDNAPARRSVLKTDGKGDLRAAGDQHFSQRGDRKGRPEFVATV